MEACCADMEDEALERIVAKAELAAALADEFETLEHKVVRYPWPVATSAGEAQLSLRQLVYAVIKVWVAQRQALEIGNRFKLAKNWKNE
jgi:hypothetical protein